MKEINDVLEKDGRVRLGTDVAEKFGLPLKFIKEFIQNTPSIIEFCQIDKDMLISVQFQKQEELNFLNHIKNL